MANPTMTLIASNTVGSGGVASVTFSSIPQTYTDLIVKVSVRTNFSSVIDGTRIRFNNDTTSGNYTGRRLFGDGSVAYSDTDNVGNVFANGNTSTSNTFSNCDVYVPNYTSGSAKSYSTDNASETNATTQYCGFGSQLWSGTAAITTMTFSVQNGTLFLANSTFYLYGINNS